MSQSTIDLDKGQLATVLTNKTDLNAAQIDQILPVTVEKIFNGLRKEVMQDNSFGLFNKLNSEHISYSNPIISHIGSELITYLVNHYKISDSSARSVVSLAIPYVIREIAQKLNLTGDADGEPVMQMENR